MKQPPAELAERLIEVSDQLRGTGFDVTVDEVAKLAGVPRATLYYYFSGKDDLVAFFLAHKLDSVERALTGAAAGPGSVVERVETALRAVLDAFAEHPALCTDLPIAVLRAGNFQEVAGRLERVVLAPLRELLVEGRATGELRVIDPALTAAALVGGLTQASSMLVLRGGEIDARAIGDALIPIFVRGLAIQPPPRQKPTSR
ncbi:MAG: TetR/AcrR family transcriptional regulator [Chloroflexi bacterium]|nr:TetR/AcrR family transcriptional regulator [Chloroflexota bacterium]